MGEKKVLGERYNKTAEKLKHDREEFLTEALERGKECKWTIVKNNRHIKEVNFWNSQN